MRRGIFGGSFDPVHLGHLEVAEAAADRLRLDVVHFIPARQQPFKAGLHAASPKDRVAMLRAALQDYPRFVLDEREITREGTSYTVDTVRSLAAEAPGDELFLLVGADTARDLREWRESDALPRLAHIVVLTRPGVEPPSHALVTQVLEVPAVDISATMVRERVHRGEEIRQLVPPTVADYIAAHWLYQPGD